MDMQANLLGRTPHRGHATRPTPVPAARSPVQRNGCRPTQMLIRNRVSNGIPAPGSAVLGVLRGTSPNAQRPAGRPGANNGKRSRRGEGQGTAQGYVQQNGLMSVPTPIRSTSAPSLPGDLQGAVPMAKSPEVPVVKQKSQPVVHEAVQAPPQPTASPQQAIMDHLPWLAEKRTTLLQLLAEWSQSQGVLEELTGRLRRLGHDRPHDQGPGELETGLRQVIAMVSRDLLQQFEFLELKASSYENLRVAFHGAGEPAPVLPTPPTRPPEIVSPEKVAHVPQVPTIKEIESSPSRQRSAPPAFVGTRPVVPRLQLGNAKNGVDIETANLNPTPSASSDDSQDSPVPRSQENKDDVIAMSKLARSASCAALIQERKVSMEASPLTKQRILHQAVVEEEVAIPRALRPVSPPSQPLPRHGSVSSPQRSPGAPIAPQAILREAASPMMCKVGALYASAATLPQAASPLQVQKHIPMPVATGAVQMSIQPHVQIPARLSQHGQRVGVTKVPMGRAMSTSALHAQVVARFPGAAGAPIPVPACAWK